MINYHYIQIQNNSSNFQVWLTTFQLHNLTDLDDSPPLFTNSVKAGAHPSCFHAVFVGVNLTWLFKIGRSTKTSRCPILGGTGFLRVYREKNKEGAGRDSLNRLILRGAGFKECRCLELSLYITKSHVTVRFSLFFNQEQIVFFKLLLLFILLQLSTNEWLLEK